MRIWFLLYLVVVLPLDVLFLLALCRAASHADDAMEAELARRARLDGRLARVLPMRRD